jgi:hypothetical protein
MFGRSPEANRLPRSEAMACRPVRNPEVNEETADGDRLRLCYPLRSRPWAARMARWFGAEDSVVIKRLELDAMGTAVWRRIDGETPVRAIAKELAETYRLHPREAEVATAQFLRDLGRRGLIGLK